MILQLSLCLFFVLFASASQRDLDANFSAKASKVTLRTEIILKRYDGTRHLGLRTN